MGWAILPVPHGWIEPRFEWVGYKTRRPQAWELKNWLGLDIGVGVVCGKVSGNLVALEFTGLGAYRHWQAEHPKVAAELPTFIDGWRWFVLFRMEEKPEPGTFFLIGFEGKAGLVRGDGDLVVLPPTRHGDRSREDDPTTEVFGEPPTAEKRKWQKQPGLEIPLLTYNQAGVIWGEREVVPRELTYREGTRWKAEAEKRKQEGLSDRDKYGHLFCSAVEYLKDPVGLHLDWLVKGFLPASYLTIMSGDSKSGKSHLLTHLANSVAAGEPFLGMDTKQGAVLWVAYEECREERGLSLLAFEKELENFYLSHSKLHIDTRDGLAALRWWIRQTDAKLLVLDPLYEATTVESLSDGRSARKALSGLKELCMEERCAAIVLHHFTKDVSSGVSRERVAESNQLLAAASMDILFDWQTMPNGSRRICLRSRGRGDFANQVWLIGSDGLSDFRLLAHGSQADIDAFTRDESILGPLQRATEPLTAHQIAEALGINVRSLRNRLPELVKLGVVSISAKAGNELRYCLA